MDESNPETMMPIWCETTRKLALLLFPLLGVLWLVSGDLLSLLFTDAYAASIPVFRIWLCVLLLAVFPAHGPLRVLGDTRFLALQTMVKLAIVVVFINGFLSAFGLSGGVLVALCAMLVGKSMLLARIKHLAAVPVSQLLPWRSYGGILVAGAAAVVPAVAVRAVATASFDRLVVTGVTYLAAYAVLAWSLGLLNASEKRALIDRGRRFLGRSTGRRSSPVE